MRNIPNALTLLNLLSGFAGIVLLFNGEVRWVLICAAIALAADVADGMVARLLKASSELGMQLDSFADLISFGILPGSIIAYLWVQSCDMTFGLPVIVMASLIPLATAIRLAKFNLDTRDRIAFYGLPSPSAAFFVFGILLLHATDPNLFQQLACDKWAFAVICVGLPFALLSNLRLWSLKGLSKPGGMVIMISFTAMLIILIFFIKALAVPVMVINYLLFGIANSVLKIY